ncbi:EF-hand domain-containing protein D2 [Hemicordylus capensis]|nr:EF-hand domain-containing protein D2 [Hemicordylus capensis]
MATDELASKLSRRLQVEEAPDGQEEEEAAEGEEAPESLEAAAEPALDSGADGELSAKLQRRSELNEPGQAQQLSPGGGHRVFSPYTEFREFSRRQIKDMERLFRQYDAGKDGFIDLMELKLMMEKLGAPQTHLGLKNMIKEVDEDFDSKLSFREFLLIFRKAAAGELEEDSGLHALARLSEIDVSTEGVKGAKSFFEAKVQAMNVTSRFEEEIKAEQEEKRRQAEEMKQRKAAFKELQSAFKQ